MSEEQKEEVKSTQDYIDAIAKLKANSVDIKEYEKLQQEKKELLDSIINNPYKAEVEKKPEAPVKSVEELKNSLMSCELNNLEYVETALQLRKQVIASGEQDPFLPSGSKIIPTNDDYEAAERVAQVLQECVDYAEGDSGVFTNELYRRTI